MALTATLQASSAGAASKRIPSRTSSVTVTQETGASVSISWQRVKYAAGYDLYLDGARIGKTLSTAYTYANLRCGSTYTLGVQAFNNKGVSSSVVSVAASTAACPVPVGGNDTTAPTPATSLTQGATTATTISLLWSAAVDNVGVAGYDLFLNGTKVGTTEGASYTFGGLSCGMSYTLAVDAYDTAGNRSQSSAVQASTSPCADTSPPTIPGVPTQTGSTATSISILWGASLDNVGVDGYDLWRNGTNAGTTTGTTYTFSSLSCGTSYTLAVDAYDTSGNRSESAAVQASTSPCPDTSPPTTPSVPTQTGSTATSISILWGASLDNVGVAGYDLFLTGSNVGTTAATTYTFSGLSCGTSYILAVDAYDPAGNRSPLSSFSAATSGCANVSPPPPPPNNCTKTISPTSDVDGQVNSVSAGAVVCLHSGHYGCQPNDAGSVCWNNFSVSGTSGAPITVESYPGESATIGGYSAITGSYLTFTNLKIDGANSAAQAYTCPETGVTQTHGVGVDLDGANVTLDHVEVFSSVHGYMRSAIQLLNNNGTVRYSKIHDWGACPDGHDHGIYNNRGSGSQVHHNWFWNQSFPQAGWAWTDYPSESNAHFYANVVDGTGSGFTNNSTGSNNLFENNVVTSTTGLAGRSAGALVGGGVPQGSTGHVIRNNDQFNNPGDYGNCGSDGAQSSIPGQTCSGNISVDPQYRDAANHDYAVLNPSLASYGLWDGS